MATSFPKAGKLVDTFIFEFITWQYCKGRSIIWRDRLTLSFPLPLLTEPLRFKSDRKSVV